MAVSQSSYACWTNNNQNSRTSMLNILLFVFFFFLVIYFWLHFTEVWVRDRWDIKKKKILSPLGIWDSLCWAALLFVFGAKIREREKKTYPPPPAPPKRSLTQRGLPCTSHILRFWHAAPSWAGLPSWVLGAETGKATGRGGDAGGHGHPGPRVGLLGEVRRVQRGGDVSSMFHPVVLVLYAFF